jgi:CRP/FNR family cyclic AMP-dependent transcriptional regulator
MTIGSFLLRDAGPPGAFGPLVKDGWEVFGSGLVSRQYAAQTELFQEYDSPPHVYLIESGLVKLTALSADGLEMITGLRARGWLIGLAAAVLTKSPGVTACTVTEARLRPMTAKQFLSNIENNPLFARYALEVLAREVMAQMEEQIEMRSQPVESRLRHVAAELNQCGYNLRFPLKQAELAQLIGATPEHLCRISRRAGSN